MNNPETQATLGTQDTGRINVRENRKDQYSKKMFNPPFFVSMATAEKFVQPILILLAYLVPLE